MKDENTKQKYSKPKLTIHGDLRVITAAKGSNNVEAGMPKTYSANNS